MKTTVEIFRAIKVRTSELLGIVGLDTKSAYSPAQVVEKIMEDFGPSIDNFKILWTPDQDLDQNYTLCGVSVIRFDMADIDEAVPQTKLFHYLDDITVENLNRVDGALFSELNRLGIYSDVKQYSLKAIMTVEGN